MQGRTERARITKVGFNEAAANTPRKSDVKRHVRIARLSAASMRPRRIRRGNPSCAFQLKSLRCGFNEAAANTPRKCGLAAIAPIGEHRFNEAAANTPRK